jgi:hypothetical protein
MVFFIEKTMKRYNSTESFQKDEKTMIMPYNVKQLDDPL